MRTWQVERRKRTRQLIELGGLIVKSGIVDLTGDDRTTIYGALLWAADKLKGDERERARALWVQRGSKHLTRTQQHATSQIERLQQFAVDATTIIDDAKTGSFKTDVQSNVEFYRSSPLPTMV